MSSTCNIVKVPGLIPNLKQSKNLDCWAIITTILISWREQLSYNIDTIMDRLGSEYLKIYEDDTGLPINKVNDWLFVSGFIKEESQFYSQTNIREMLKEFGPLVFTTTKEENGLYLIHARIVTGMQNTEGVDSNGECNISNTDSTEIFGIDPTIGMEFTLPFSTFCKEFEHQYSDCKLFAQVIHFPTQIMFINNLRK